MERTTISLESELHDQLKAIATQKGVSVATVIREMLKEGCTQRPRRFISLGMGASDTPIDPEVLNSPTPPATWRSS